MIYITKGSNNSNKTFFIFKRDFEKKKIYDNKKHNKNNPFLDPVNKTATKNQVAKRINKIL